MGHLFPVLIDQDRNEGVLADFLALIHLSFEYLIKREREGGRKREREI